MINMIKADIYRMVRSVGFYVSLGIMLLLIGVSIYLVEPGYIGMVAGPDDDNVNSFEESLSEDEGNLKADLQEGVVEKDITMREYRKKILEIGNFEFDRGVLSSNMNLYYIFIFIAGIAIAMEFSGGCIKNTLSSAISRKKYFASKAVFTYGLCTLMVFLNTYIIYFANIIFNGRNLSSSLWTVTKVTLMQLPPALALMSVVFGIAFMFKRTAAYNMVAIPFVMVFQLLFNTAVSIFDIPKKYAYYELQSMINRLANYPSHSYIMKSYGVCAVIIVLFVTLGYVGFKKAEIK